jgi:hypothetical protein
MRTTSRLGWETTYPIIPVVAIHDPPSDHCNMVRASDIDVEKKSYEMTIVEMSDTVIHPWTVMICVNSVNEGISTCERTHPFWGCICFMDLEHAGNEERQTHRLHCLQWCALGGLYLLQDRQCLGPLVSFLTSKGSPDEVSGSYWQKSAVAAFGVGGRETTNPRVWHLARVSDHA